MNILMIHPHDLFSRQEPWTVRIRRIAESFGKRGHAVKLVYFPLVYRAQSAYTAGGIEYVPLSRRAGIRDYARNIRVIGGFAAWADVIHFQKCFYHAAFPAILGGLRHGKHLHYDWDDWEIKIFNFSARQPRLIGGFLALTERLLPKLCDTVSVSSRRLREECIRYGVRPGRVFMAPVGADPELFHPAVSGVRIREKYNLAGPLVAYLGQLHGGQYAELFVKAAKIVLNRVPGVKFMIVGGGYRLPELKKMAAALELEEEMIFTGAVAHEEVPLYVAAADIAVACFEDNEITRCKSPLKIAEYMAGGKPIVASDVGEVKSMLAGAGLLTRPGDSAELAGGIVKLLEDEPLRKRLGVKARTRAEEIYNWENTAANLLKAYGQTAAE